MKAFFKDILRIPTGILLAITVSFVVQGTAISAESKPVSPEVEAHRQKEAALVETLKKPVNCKNMGFYDDGDLYCFLSFRGLELNFAGVNAKNDGTIYVTALGKNQTVSSLGSRCLEIAFGDKDLRGVIELHTLFRDDGVITHKSGNKLAWAECR